MPPKTLRAATYARYSTDLQSNASIEDQQRVCQRLITDRGWMLALAYSDAGISGASLMRPSYQRLLQDARNGKVDVVVSEGLDRISRDQEHIAAFYKQMKYLGIPVVTIAEGEISEIHIGLKGTMSALFIKDLAQKTHRGLEGRARKGKSAGGISYGYSVTRAFNADGTPVTGERDIIPEEAAIVARIFREYDTGHSARAIAARLNEEGISSPRSNKGSGTWGPSTISGKWKRGTGILNNELYIERLIWDRLNYAKNPETQRRQSRLNDVEGLVNEAVPHLQIVDDALWQRVKARQAAIREDMNPAGVKGGNTRPENARRPNYLFSGLLVCGCCGASYTLINKTRYGCAGARNKGEAICSNRATIEREVVEDRVLTGLRDSLLHPELIATFVEDYRRAFNAEAAGADAAREKARRDLGQIDKKIRGILAAIEDGMYQPSMKDRMVELEAEKATLQRSLEHSPEPLTLRLHPSLSDLYRSKIRNLASALQEPGLKMEATEALRGLISEVRMIPDAYALNGHRIALAGELAGLLSLGETQNTRSGMATGCSVTMVAGGRGKRFSPDQIPHCEALVAGVGFEPVTFRL